MKLPEANVHSRGRGVQSKSKFKIEASRKAFEILSSSLYQDKVKAIIRELSTNAVDAHIDAGTLDTPYEVKLPTQYDCTFKIRDYGTGMSRNKLEHLYTTYFGSDKSDSNDFTGCLGLGSKSPFSYTGSFSVTSFYNGEKYIYVAAIGEDGVPEINLMSESRTKEPNGMAIEFAVNEGDIDEFTSKAKLVYKYFRHRPKISGQDILLKDVTYILEGNGWKIRSGREESMALMGNIAYPINPSHFGSSDDAWNKSVFQQLLGAGVEIQFEIGELDITPSRDALQYTSQVIKCIKDKLEEFKVDIEGVMSKKFDACTNLWEARVLYKEMSTTDGLMEMFRGTKVSLKYQGEEINTKISLFGQNEIKDLSVQTVEQFGYSDRCSKRQYTNGFQFDVDATTTFLFVEKDIATNFYQVTRNKVIEMHQKQKNARSAAGHSYSYRGPTSVKAYIFDFQTPAAKQALLDAFGFDESYLVKASSLPKPTASKNSYGVRKAKVFKLVRQTRHRAMSQYWEDENVDMNTGGVYVDVKRYAWDSQGVSVHTLVNILVSYESCGIKVPDVIGVKSAIISKFVKHKKWVDLEDYLLAELDKFASQHSTDLAKHNAYAKWHDEVDYSESDNYHSMYTHLYTDIKLNKEFKQFLGDHEAYRIVSRKSREVFNSITYAYGLLKRGNKKVFVASGVNEKSLVDLYATVLKNYPLLKVVANTHHRDWSKELSAAVASYINLVDKN